MFEVLEREKHTKEEKKLLFLESLAALAVFGMIGVVVWMVFFNAAV
jgi:hypothetical protein